MVKMIKAVRERNGTGLGEMKAFVYNLPQRVYGWLPLDSCAEPAACTCSSVTQVQTCGFRLPK